MAAPVCWLPAKTCIGRPLCNAVSFTNCATSLKPSPRHPASLASQDNNTVPTSCAKRLASGRPLAKPKPASVTPYFVGNGNPNNPKPSAPCRTILRPPWPSIPFKSRLLNETKIGQLICCVPPAHWNALSVTSVAAIAWRSCFTPMLVLDLPRLNWLPVFHEPRIHYRETGQELLRNN